MTDDERADRRSRIKTVVESSNQRVNEFLDLMTKMYAARLRDKRARQEAHGDDREHVPMVA